MKKANNQNILKVMLAVMAILVTLAIPLSASAQTKKTPLTDKEVKAYFTDWWD